MSRVRENRTPGSTGGSWKRNQATAADEGSSRETERHEPGLAYGWSPRQLPTQPSSAGLLGGAPESRAVSGQARRKAR